MINTKTLDEKQIDEFNKIFSFRWKKDFIENENVEIPLAIYEYITMQDAIISFIKQCQKAIRQDERQRIRTALDVDNWTEYIDKMNALDILK